MEEIAELLQTHMVRNSTDLFIRPVSVAALN
jgi:hypothetical protein